MSTTRPVDHDPETEPLGDPSDDAGDSSYRISRAAVVLIALALGIGLLIGRASVKTDDTAAPSTPTPSPSPSSTVPFGPKSLQYTGAECSIQKGSDLVLGVEARNVSTVPLILKKLLVTVPTGSMTIVSRGVGSCGEFDVPKLEDFGLAPQGAVWFSTTVHPSEKCPAPYSVKMTVDLTDPTGRAETISIGGFDDLAHVPWSGCPASS
jgi:hypothetical protein